jgi:hypothetical protein
MKQKNKIYVIVRSAPFTSDSEVIDVLTSHKKALRVFKHILREDMKDKANQFINYQGIPFVEHAKTLVLKEALQEQDYTFENSDGYHERVWITPIVPR